MKQEASRRSGSLGLIGHNLAWVTISYIGGALAGFLAQAIMARELGRPVFGEYVAALSLVTVLAVLYELGASDYLVRQAARDPGRLPRLVGELVEIKLGMGGVVLVLSLAGALVLGFHSREIVVTGLLALMLGANAIGKPFRSGLQSIERLDVASRISLANAAISAIGMAALLLAGYGLVPAVAWSLIVSLVMLPVSWRALRRHARVRPLRSGPAAWRLVLESFPFTAITLLTTAIAYADALIIRTLLGPAETGTYGAAFRLFLVLQFLPSAYLDSVYRSLSDLAHRDRAAFRALVDRSAAALLVLALPLAVGGAVLARAIMVLVFGDDFADGAEVFAVLVAALPASFPLWILLAAIAVDGRPRDAAAILALALVANLTANLLLVPSYGIVASAWITLATDAGIAAVATMLLRRRGLRLRWPVLGAPAVAAAGACGAVALALRDLPLLIPIVAGALAYAVSLWLTGVPSRLGLPSMRRLFGARPG
jgi:O-antigen/teichoic acid export membrane protein